MPALPDRSALLDPALDLPTAADVAAPDLIVIPARYGSKRLPGKPLIAIAGRTLLERVAGVARRAAELAGNVTIVVATDDARIEDHARALGCAVAMTDAAISSGSGRAHAAALMQPRAPGILVNLQGDAPFVPPEVVAGLIAAIRASEAPVATPVVRMAWEDLDVMREHKRAAPFSGTTCIRAPDGRALWFSKSILPAIRDEAVLREKDARSPVFRHLGLYAYRMAALARFEASPPSTYETLEGLEQLRFLEMGIAIQTIEVTPPRHAMSGIDTLEDVGLAEKLIAQLGDPFDA